MSWCIFVILPRVITILILTVIVDTIITLFQDLPYLSPAWIDYVIVLTIYNMLNLKYFEAGLMDSVAATSAKTHKIIIEHTAPTSQDFRTATYFFLSSRFIPLGNGFKTKTGNPRSHGETAARYVLLFLVYCKNRQHPLL